MKRNGHRWSVLGKDTDRNSTVYIRVEHSSTKMGMVSSMCKRRKRNTVDSPVHDTYTPASILKVSTSGSLASEQTQCSAMSREPTKHSSMRYHYYLPQEQQIYSTSMKSIRGDPDLPLFSTPFYIPFNGKSPTIHHRSNPYVAHAYSHVTAPASPALQRADPPQTTSTSTTIPMRAEPSITTDTPDSSSKQHVDDRSRLVKRTASAPIDMFLIDISTENVLVGQPVSLNIRHLLLDTVANQQKNSSAPIRVEPASSTTYAHENLLDYIPYVCERYPNSTVEADRLTRNSLHFRMPSEFSRSLNALIWFTRFELKIKRRPLLTLIERNSPFQSRRLSGVERQTLLFRIAFFCKIHLQSIC